MKIVGCLALALAFVAAGCNRNTAIGNDREAAREPAAAPVRSAGAALSNISAALIKPETMSDADIAAIGGTDGRCVFTLTELSFPAFVFEPQGQGFLKLNGTLIPLDRAGEQRFGTEGLRVAVRWLDEEGNAGLQAMEMIVMPPDAEDELGYRGYGRCEDGAGAGNT